MTPVIEKVGRLFAELSESQINEIAEIAGLLTGTVILRLGMRRYGATKLQRYVAVSVVGGIITTNLRLKRIIKLLEAQQSKPVTSASYFLAGAQPPMPMTEVDLKIRGL